MAEPTTWVYRCYCDHGGLMYVGIASDVRRRLRQHHSKPWWSDVTVVLVDLHRSRADALRLESFLIDRDRPRHNINGRRSDLTEYADAGVPSPLAEDEYLPRPNIWVSELAVSPW